MNMKNKKMLIGCILLSTALIVFILSTINVGTISKRLGADVISYPTSQGAMISCDAESIAVGESTTCTLTAKMPGGAKGVEGRITYDHDGLSSVMNVNNTALGWDRMGASDEGVIVIYGGLMNQDTFIIATLEVSGTIIGEYDITFTKAYNNQTPFITDSNGDPIAIDDATTTITVTPAKGGEDPQEDDRSQNSNIRSVTVDGSEIYPSLTKTVDYDVTSVSISVVPEDENATAYIDGTEVVGSVNKELSVGDNEFALVVKAENPEYSTNQTITITRKQEETVDPTPGLSDDNKLKGLSVKGYTLTPEFDSNTEGYVVKVGNDVTSLEITATPNNSNAKVELSGNTISTSETEKVIKVTVTAQNNSTKIYSIKVERTSSSNTNNGGNSGSSEGTTNSCTLSSSVYKVDNTKLTIEGVNSNHSEATIKNNLKSTCGTITVNNNKVTLSYNGNTKVYVISTVWTPQTGMKVVKYTLIIAVIAAAIASLLFVKKKMDK